MDATTRGPRLVPLWRALAGEARERRAGCRVMACNLRPLANDLADTIEAGDPRAMVAGARHLADALAPLATAFSLTRVLETADALEAAAAAIDVPPTP